MKHLVVVVFANKLLLSKIMQSLRCSIVIKVNIALRVHDESKQIVRTRDSLDM